MTRARQPKLTMHIEPKLLAKLQAETRRLKVSQRALVETILKERLEGVDNEDTLAILVRRLNRIDNNQKVATKQTEVLAETLALFVRVWLASTAEVPDDQRQTAVIKAQARYERFLASLAKRLSDGQTIFGELPKERTLHEDDF